jgi:hypothetical protein
MLTFDFSAMNNHKVIHVIRRSNDQNQVSIPAILKGRSLKIFLCQILHKQSIIW